MREQLPYFLSIISLFWVYGTAVRRGYLAGRAIVGVGVFVGLIAVAASFLNFPPDLRRTLPLPLLLLPPASMAVCAAVCVWYAYRAQRVEDIMATEIEGTRVIARYAPARRIATDALLLPTATTLRMAPGTAAALATVGGAAITREARASAPVPLGKVVATGGGPLPVERIFHVAVYEPLRAADEAALRRGLENAAQRARKAGAKRLAVPVGPLPGLPLHRVAVVTLEAVLKQRRSFEEIVFVALVERSLPALRDALARTIDNPLLPRKNAG